MNEGAAGRQPHPVTRGLHDSALRKLVHRGEPLDLISRELACSRDLIVRRMRTLYEGIPRHPVAQGTHDGVLISMAQQGERVVAIADRLDCSPNVVEERLRALGEAVRT